MGGFRVNGCGAVDYFTKMKYLGNYMCPNCKVITPFYLEKGKFKISVLWIPTVTLKERYGIMCALCQNGKWIEDAEAYKLLGGNSYSPNETGQNEVLQNELKGSFPKCPQCGAEVDGAFCGACGTKYSEPEVVIEAETIKKCSKCGAKVEGTFCGKCGAKLWEVMDEPGKAEIESEEKASQQEWECSLCGTKNPQNLDKCSLCGCEKD